MLFDLIYIGGCLCVYYFVIGDCGLVDLIVFLWCRVLCFAVDWFAGWRMLLAFIMLAVSY